jgi:hypothetical protein
MTFRREAREAVLLVILLPRLWLPSLLFVCTRRGLLRVVVSGYGILEVRDEAVKRVVDLLEERHAAAALV